MCTACVGTILGGKCRVFEFAMAMRMCSGTVQSVVSKQVTSVSPTVSSTNIKRSWKMLYLIALCIHFVPCEKRESVYALYSLALFQTHAHSKSHGMYCGNPLYTGINFLFPNFGSTTGWRDWPAQSIRHNRVSFRRPFQVSHPALVSPHRTPLVTVSFVNGLHAGT